MKLQVVTEVNWQPFGTITFLPFSTHLAVHFTPALIFNGPWLQSICLTSRKITPDKGREHCFDRWVALILINCMDGPKQDARFWSQKKVFGLSNYILRNFSLSLYQQHLTFASGHALTHSATHFLSRFSSLLSSFFSFLLLCFSLSHI